MENGIGFKKKVLAEILQRKSDQLQQLVREQSEKLESVNMKDVDKVDVEEGPREELMDEIALQARSIDHLSDEVTKLKDLNPEKELDTVSPGSLVKTNNGYFLICVAHNAIDVDGKKIMGISTEAPLYQQMKGLSKGANFRLKDTEYTVLDLV